jgi:hypothetical protein
MRRCSRACGSLSRPPAAPSSGCRTAIGAGGNVDYVLVNGELINTDIADKCASRPG